jgi:hypothetical protein
LAWIPTTPYWPFAAGGAVSGRGGAGQGYHPAALLSNSDREKFLMASSSTELGLDNCGTGIVGYGMLDRLRIRTESKAPAMPHFAEELF